MPDTIARRNFIKAIGVAGAAAALPNTGVAQPSGGASAQVDGSLGGSTPAPHVHATSDLPSERVHVFFTAPEAAFVSAAVDRLIPPDDTGPGAVQAGVVTYIDRQLAGAFGHGYRMYLAGPWPEGASPTQGYQLPLTPAEIYRLGIAEVDRASRKANQEKSFVDLDAAHQDAILQSLDKGEMQLDMVPGKLFFDLLLANSIEGYFGDPAYGGNRDMATWKMIGFPGARGDYADEIVAYRNKPYPELPQRLADLQ